MLPKLEARAPRAVLEELVRYASLHQQGEPLVLPRVTLHLSTGRDFLGTVVDLREERMQGPCVALSLASADPRHADADALYVPLGAVIAVTVHEAAQLGGLPRSVTPKTKLELKRLLAERQGAVAAPKLEAELDAVGDSAEAAYALELLIERLAETLKVIAADPAGQEALGAVERIVLRVGEEPAASKDERTLSITTGVRALARFRPDALRTELEKLL